MASTMCSRSNSRGFKGPRDYDTTGLPLHYDNQSIFKERIFLDAHDAGILHDVITVFDHALTRPWTVDKRYVRNSDPLQDWPEFLSVPRSTPRSSLARTTTI